MTDLRAAMQPAGTAYDLTPLTNALLRRKNKAAKAAGHSLKNLRDTKSAVNDLFLAKEMMIYLRSFDEQQVQRRLIVPAAVSGACFAQAILLYIRATEAGGERRNLRVKSKLSPEQKIVHKRLDDLRNKVIAHLDEDRSYGNKSFADQKLVLVHNGDGYHRLQLADRRIVFQDEVEDDFAALLDSAIDICQDELVERQQDVSRHISDLSKTDAAVAPLIEGYPFDVEAFFGNPEQAKGFRDHGVEIAEPKRPRGFFTDWPDPV